MVKLKVVGCLLKRELLLKKFKAEIKYRTRRQQPKNLEMVIASINPAILIQSYTRRQWRPVTRSEC